MIENDKNHISEEQFDRIESNVTCLLDKEALYIFGQNLAWLATVLYAMQWTEEWKLAYVSS